MTKPVHDDAQDFSEQLESLRPDLVRFAFWLARDASIAEDLVQESLLRAWRARTRLRTPAATRPWLLTIVRREHARLYERKRLELVDIDECMTEELGTVDDDPESTELRQAMLALPHEYREPLVLQLLGGFTTDEIATELGLSASAVLTRLFRARNKLREMYAPASEAAGTVASVSNGSAL